MSDGKPNGIDLAAVYQLLTEVARTVSAHDRRFDEIDRQFERVGRQFEQVGQQFREIDRQLVTMTADIGGLRGAVTHYHASVLGHGMLISEPEERLRRVERHLNLTGADD